jgi:hypothetical protein
VSIAGARDSRDAPKNRRDRPEGVKSRVRDIFTMPDLIIFSIHDIRRYCVMAALEPKPAVEGHELASRSRRSPTHSGMPTHMRVRALDHAALRLRGARATAGQSRVPVFRAISTRAKYTVSRLSPARRGRPVRAVPRDFVEIKEARTNESTLKRHHLHNRSKNSGRMN